jgi:two-component system, NarL family, invasion response regulator UvrY
MRVLIADDHPVVRHGLRQILETSGDMTIVGEARNGTETIELSRKLDWDVAIMDYLMPGPSGLDLLKELKRAHPGRPVLVLSLCSEELYALRVLKAGGSGYVSKEAASEELVPAIRKVVSGGRYVSAALAERIAFGVSSDFDKAPHETLSEREYRVMWLLASGKAIFSIARELSLTSSTVSTYRGRILKKLHITSNADIVHYAVRHNLVN